MSKSKRKMPQFWDIKELSPEANDKIKKMLSGAINAIHDRIDAIAPPEATATKETPVTRTDTPIVPIVGAPAPFKQKWYKNGILVNDDVRDVYVENDLDLYRYGVNGVRLLHIPVVTAAGGVERHIPARIGSWVIHDFSPLGYLGQQNLRYELDFVYAKVASGVVLEFGLATGAANLFKITANSGGPWILSAYNANVCTFPAPSAGIHTLIIEFNGTAGSGAAQWRVWLNNGGNYADDPYVEQTVTTGTNGAVTAINAALIFASGGNYSDPFIASPPGPTTIFDGAIVREMIYTDITGDPNLPPPTGYTGGGGKCMVMWNEARDLVDEDWTEGARCAMTLAPGHPPQPSQGGFIPWLNSPRTRITATPNQAMLGECVQVPDLGGRPYGFPPTTIAVNGVNSVPGEYCDVILQTENVPRISNRAFASVRKWSLFHNPQPADLNAAEPIWFRTRASYFTPEPIGGKP